MEKNSFILGEYVQGVKNRCGRIVELPDFPAASKPVSDAYTSVYRFDSALVDHCKDKKSVSGYHGPCRAVALHFDFDSPHGDLSLREIKSFVEKILSTDSFNTLCDDLKIYFSGNKGFHLLICNEEIKNIPATVNTPDTVKKICTKLAGEFFSFDRSVYDRTRLFRIINSRHLKSGLYKIPLYLHEIFILSMDEIREMARTPRNLQDKSTFRNFYERAHYGTT